MDQQVICYIVSSDLPVPKIQQFPLQLLLGLLGNASLQRCLTTLITAARETKNVCKKKLSTLWAL